MATSRSEVEIKEFHTLASNAASDGVSIKGFARDQGTLANNVKALLYEAVIHHGLSPVTFPPEPPRQRRRSKMAANLSKVKIYTGRAKVPYLTVKVPRSVVAESKAAEGDVFEWRTNKKGELVGVNLTARRED